MAEFIPYGSQWIDEEDIAAVSEVLRNGFLTQGPKVSKFETKLAQRVGAAYCVGFCNATSALHATVMALDLPAGSQGITSPNTFVASSNCMAYAGIRPDFCDIEPHSLNISAASITQRVTEQTRLLIPVHFGGLSCEMQSIGALAKQNGYRVIEDASHAIGSFDADGAPIGSCRHSDATIFSFHPVKTMTTGEGGAVTTNDPELYRKLCLYRSHGISKDPETFVENPGPWYYEQILLGFNYRITDIQCVLGIRQLDRLSQFRSRRQEIRKRYADELSEIPGLVIPQSSHDDKSCHHLQVLHIDFESLGFTRKELMQKLADEGIGSQVHYIPVYHQPWYRSQYDYPTGYCPNAEAHYQKALSIPLYARLTENQVDHVIQTLKKLVRPI